MKYAVWLVVALAQLAGLPMASAETARIRGTLIEFDVSKITVAKRDGGVEPIGIDSNTRYLSVTPVGIDAIKPGSYIGVAGLPQADGTIKALGVMVFPEQARGMNEGSFPWDLQPESTMTNATVAKVETAASGREVQVTYKGGSQTIEIVDAGAIASFAPASESALVEGAKVTVFVEQGAGLPTARSVLVGKDGFTPPN
ncbi:MAG TPA: hypothetical protein VHL31_03410 [Geminicoccus sp.]|jgi:hypothetical protein|uniref:hypothetical protein n=1 Tax=Geminicoccus sp. TaxID=2024832 RepID=UPI002E32A82C|nr:hypothetical protein [Geminicoccus sp.]HEX2525335.1 hypothetical protein [Geminicoccus sp.]